MNAAGLIESTIAAHSLTFFLCQWLCIVLISLLGYLIIRLRSELNNILSLFLCFPVGLACFILVGCALLILGCPYSAVSVILGCLLFVLVLLFLKGSGRSILPTNRTKTLLIGVLIICLTAAVCVSGILPVSVSNDTYYFFGFYPRYIVTSGGLRDGFDVYLTDVGLGSAVMGSMPYLFGFNEFFGIQYMLSMSFLGVFIYGTYELSEGTTVKERVLFTALAVILLLAATPLQIIARWALSNVFFMEYMFITAYLACRFRTSEEAGNRFLLVVMSLALSILRMEGGVYI